MFLKDSTKPLAHRWNTDAEGHWEARCTELNALIDELMQAEQLPEDAATEYAFALLDGLLDAAQDWDRAALLAQPLAAAA